MNVMRYDAAVVGNHEFNYGVVALRSAIAQAAFPFLAANVHDASGAPLAAPFTIVQRGAVKVGIVGATTPGAMVWDRDNLRDAQVTVSDIVPAVRQAVADARGRGADIIVVLLHSGLSEAASYDTAATAGHAAMPSENVAARVAREVNGIDLIVYGHSHKELVDSTINGALLMQPRNWAATVGVATLQLERVDKHWRVRAHRGQSIATAGHGEAPEVLAASTATHRATIAWATAPSGRSNVAWRADSARVTDQPITDLVNEVMRRETGADLAATAVFSLDASLDSGSISRAQIARLYPYDNTLRAIRISGVQLRAFLEHASRYYRTLAADGRAPAGGLIDPAIPGFNFDVLAGADYTIDLSKPVGARITRLLVKGRAVSPSDSFTLALNNYRQGGGGGYAMLAGAPVVYEKDIDIRQLVLDEVARASANGGALDPSRYATRNWRIEPATAIPMAYEEQRAMRASEASGGPTRALPVRKRPPTDTLPPPAPVSAVRHGSSVDKVQERRRAIAPQSLVPVPSATSSTVSH
jgi:2',3'-cyclic-nucleotide 2'-phosphodiesterase/3'-nucleotidase